MILANLKNKRLAILGLGVENYFLIKWLLKHKAGAQITICDKRNMQQLGDKFSELNKYQNITWQLGEEFNQNLDRYDILLRAPGWPISCPGIQKALKQSASAKGFGETSKKLVLSSPMKMFFDYSPTKNIIGITGTKGKGTTSSLIFAILKMARKKVFLGGNIGVAPFSFIDKLTTDSFVVLELSSFQLEDLHRSPKIAVFTNFTPEHLAPADPNNPNYHPTLKHYFASKFNIAKWQKAGDCFVVNQKMEKKIQAQNLKSKIIYFGKSDLPSGLPGEHNRENIGSAVCVAQILKIVPEIILKTVEKFKGLEHRIEFVKKINGVEYYDDSFATTPDSAIIALKSFPFDYAQGRPPVILLAGGADKGADFKNFAKEIKKRVKFVILFAGAATPRLQKNIIAAGFDAKKIKVVKAMSEAVSLAKAKADGGDKVLLSTACASFGMFANYKERGDLFKKEVLTLK